MKKYFHILLACIVASSCCNGSSVVDKGYAHAEKQLAIALVKADSVIAESWPKGDTLVSPRTFEKGKFKMLKAKAWTSGFFPGSLWYMYEYTGKEEWKQAAIRFQSYIENQKKNKGTHALFSLGMVEN